MPAPTTRAPKVVIVGAGLGGLAAERALRRVPVAVTVVDAHNYATFAPEGPPAWPGFCVENGSW